RARAAGGPRPLRGGAGKERLARMASHVNKSYTVLAVEDDAAALANVARATATLGQRLLTTSNVMDALPLIEREDADIVLCTLDVPALGGLEFAALLRQSFPHV